MEKLMDKISDYIAKKNELEQLHNELKEEFLQKAIDMLIWENENIGERHDINSKGTSYSYHIWFNKDDIELKVESSWSYGGYDVEEYVIPYEKLLSDEWKKDALLEYQEKMVLIEQAKIERERKEYERLKEIFDVE